MQVGTEDTAAAAAAGVSLGHGLTLVEHAIAISVRC
jgi:hypothetical protein